MKINIIILGVLSVLLFSCVTVPEKTDQIQDSKEHSSVSKAPSKEKQEQEIKKHVLCIDNSFPQERSLLLESFEDGNFWQIYGRTKADDFAIETGCSGEWFFDGENSGVWTFSNVPRNQSAAFFCKSLIQNDWTGAKSIVATIYNPGNPLDVFLELSGDVPEDTVYTEKVSLGTGVNKNVLFDIRHQLTDREGNLIGDLFFSDNITGVSFIIPGKTSGGSLMVDSIYLVY